MEPCFSIWLVDYALLYPMLHVPWDTVNDAGISKLTLAKGCSTVRSVDTTHGDPWGTPRVLSAV